MTAYRTLIGAGFADGYPDCPFLQHFPHRDCLGGGDLPRLD